MDAAKLFINGEWVESQDHLDVTNKYDGAVIGRVCVASPEDVVRAIDAACEARSDMASLTAHKRGDILDKVSTLIKRDAKEIAGLITREAGKAVFFSKGEVSRGAETFKFSADEARRLGGELIPFDAAASGANRFGFAKRYPVGIVGAITPFNFPLNLVAHKVGPAIAAGCPIILKPASATPLTAVKLVALLLEAGLPPGGITLLNGPGGTVGEQMVVSDKIAMISFTGSPAVGMEIRQKAGMKKTALELGNNSAVIICEDADIEAAAPKCAVGALANSGQVCISVQRIYIHESKYDAFRDLFLDVVRFSKVGDPEEPDTIVGPMIDENEAVRIEEWVREAANAGATVTAGGRRQGRMMEPTVIENCDESMRVVCDEAFAPVVCLMKFKTLDEAIDRTNNTKYGLQAGIFTNDITAAFSAAERLEVGGVMINETPMFRVDQMPYGGVKLSGTGREGAKYSIEEMTELKTVMFNLGH